MDKQTLELLTKAIAFGYQNGCSATEGGYQGTPDEEAKDLLSDFLSEADAKTVIKDSKETAINIAVRFGGFNEAQHKAWVIDQMVRALAGDEYKQIVKDACHGEDGAETYSWDEGITP